MKTPIEKIKILVIGVGGLGCPSALALAEAGVGTLGLMDPDVVEMSNLHRQILYSKGDVGKPKVEIAAKFLARNYPKVQLFPIPDSMDAKSMDRFLPEYDLVIDGLDRLEKKFFLNDKCIQHKKPFVHAGVVKFEGQVMGVRPGEMACLRCLMPKIPPPFALPTCQEAGVLGAFSQAIGYLQAREALVMMKGETPRLWKIDAQKRETRSIVPARNPACAACARGTVEALSEACETAVG